jgi:hypothetical protein
MLVFKTSVSKMFSLDNIHHPSDLRVYNMLRNERVSRLGLVSASGCSAAASLSTCVLRSAGFFSTQADVVALSSLLDHVRELQTPLTCGIGKLISQTLLSAVLETLLL